MERKYRLTAETKEWNGYTLHRIEALKDFGNVKKGELGGWIEKEENLSHDGYCWVCDNAQVLGCAWVSGNAKVCGYAVVRDDAAVFGNAVVCGNVEVSGYAEVCGDAVIEDKLDYLVFKNFWSSNRHFTWTKSNDMWKVGCFYGTSEELVKKAYADDEKKGKFYQKYVEIVELLKES